MSRDSSFFNFAPNKRRALGATNVYSNVVTLRQFRSVDKVDKIVRMLVINTDMQNR